MWLYVPTVSTSSQSAPADSALILASSWQFQALEQSAWSRGKPSRSRNWYQQWKRAIWLQRLFGAMPEPSMAERGVEQLTASLAASRPSLTVSPDASKGRTTNATCGLTLAALSSSPGHGLSSSKTSPACSPRGLTKSLAQSGFAETFTSLASRWREDCSRRQKLARRTRESVSSSSAWPTASARDWKGSNQEEMHDRGSKGAPLNEVAVLWYTPNVPNGGRTLSADTSPTGKRVDGVKRQVGLENQANWWSTPRATDGEKGGPNQSFGAGGMPLPAQTCQWPTPRVTNNGGHGNGERALDPTNCRLEDTAAGFQHSLQAQETQTDGDTSSPGRRSLNPLFVEWLMGWPPGWTLLAWTDFGCSAMEFSHWKQRMRSALLSLGLPQEAPPAQLALFG